MPDKSKSIVQLAVQTANQITANSGNYMAFLNTAAYNFKYSFRDQLLIFAQKPDATACAEINFWNKYGRWVNRGTTGIALLVDTDRGYRLRHVFDMSDTNSREGRTIPIWQMKPQYEDAVIETLENSYGELTDKPDFGECLMQIAKIVVEDNFSDYYVDLGTVTTIHFDTLSSLGEYEIVAAFKTVAYSEDGFKYYHFVNAEDENAFDAFISQCKALALYDTGVDAEYGDKLLTLSTCEYSRNNGRMVVVAKQITPLSTEVGGNA